MMFAQCFIQKASQGVKSLRNKNYTSYSNKNIVRYRLRSIGSMVEVFFKTAGFDCNPTRPYLRDALTL